MKGLYSKAREKANSIRSKINNKVSNYGVLGDILTTDVSVKGLGALVLGGIAGISISATDVSANPLFDRDYFLRKSIERSIEYESNALSREPERPRSPEVYYIVPKEDPDKPEIFLANYWIDADGDGKIDYKNPKEIVGKGLQTMSINDRLSIWGLNLDKIAKGDKFNVKIINMTRNIKVYEGEKIINSPCEILPNHLGFEPDSFNSNEDFIVRVRFGKNIIDLPLYVSE